MKVRVEYTVDVDDEFCRALHRRIGEPGKATREEVVSWFRSHGDQENDDLLRAYGDDNQEESEAIHSSRVGSWGGEA